MDVAESRRHPILRLFAATVVLLIIAVAAALWMSRASAPKAITPLATRTSAPLVSVVTPGIQPVATEVTSHD